MKQSDLKRGERMVALLVHILQNDPKKYTITDLMVALELEEQERRNVQRDLKDLVNIPGNFIIQEGTAPKVYYRSGLSKAKFLIFPNMQNTLLETLLLNRIAGIYPSTAELITEVCEKIRESLPNKEKRMLDSLSTDLNSRILFMGGHADFQENASKYLTTILQAIKEKRKIETLYIKNDGDDKPYRSKRIPLFIVVYQKELYVGCTSSTNVGKNYFIKFRRISDVKLLSEHFQEDPKLIEQFRKKITTGGGMLGNISDTATEKIRIRARSWMKMIFNERPYVSKQTIKDEIKKGEYTGYVIIDFRAEVNESLQSYITSFGDSVEVLSPVTLCQNMAKYGKYLTHHYKKYLKG
ncbi:MAG: WYL domain-containing protein [Fibrobacter sp.]|jgi:predicted DNA-binding transcriptional regulator YafY|nr:WYL domain-containing protein [Fibrobacter sp.]